MESREMFYIRMIKLIRKFCIIIDDAFQEACLSQEELASRIYVSRQTISNWKNDKSYPDVNSLVLLSEIF